MSVTPDIYRVTDALLDMLRTNLATLPGLTGRSPASLVGDHEPPEPRAGQQVPDMPYVVLYVVDGGETISTQAQPDEGAGLAVQLTSVGASRRMAQDMGVRVADLMLAMSAGQGHTVQPVQPAGWQIGLRVVDGPRGGTMRSGTVWSMPERFRVYVTRR